MEQTIYNDNLLVTLSDSAASSAGIIIAMLKECIETEKQIFGIEEPIILNTDTGCFDAIVRCEDGDILLSVAWDTTIRMRVFMNVIRIVDNTTISSAAIRRDGLFNETHTGYKDIEFKNKVRKWFDHMAMMDTIGIKPIGSFYGIPEENTTPSQPTTEETTPHVEAEVVSEG